MASPSSFAPSSPSSSPSRSASPDLPFSATNPRPSLPPSIAFSSLRKLIALELQQHGFDSAEQDALDDLEGIVFAFLETFLSDTAAYMNHAHRTIPNAYDIISAAEHIGLGSPVELSLEVQRINTLMQDDELGYQPELKYDRKRDEEEKDWLASDDEDEVNGGGKTIEKETLVASYLPKLPPKHTYRQTPVYPQSSLNPSILPTKASASFQRPSSAALNHLSTLRSRLNNSQLVGSSLRNLIRATSARKGQDLVEDDPAKEENNDEDVVDYESEWYKAEFGGKGIKRRKLIVTIGGVDVNELAGIEAAKKTDVVGARAGKRRKWRA